MPLDLSNARATVASLLLGDSFTILRPRAVDDGAGSTIPHPGGPLRIGPLLGAFRALNGEERVEAEQYGEHGAYRLKTTVVLTDPDTDEPVEILPTDFVEVLDATYAVVWAPPPANLSLFRMVGLDNADAAVGGAGVLAQTFLGLADTPTSYTGAAGKAVIVNDDEDGLVFGDAPSGGFSNIDGGSATSIYGGTNAIDGGGA